MISCTCNRVTSHLWTTTQCWDCWRLANVKAVQKGNGIKSPEELRSRFPNIPVLGKYRGTIEAMAASGNMPFPTAAKSLVVFPEPSCVHEGAIAQRCASCEAGNDNSPRHRRWCNLTTHAPDFVATAHQHPPTIDRDQFDEPDWCTRVPVDPKILSCSACPDHRRNLLGGFPDPLPTHTPPSDEAAHIAAFRSMLVSPPPYGGDDGRTGIIWTCHSPRFFAMVAIAIRRLRKLGCLLPVEVWWRSSCGDFDKSAVKGLDVTFIDRDALAQRLQDTRLPFGDPDSGGWQVKTYAATHTRLAKFWLMDSDALFVADPTGVFDGASKGGGLSVEGGGQNQNPLNPSPSTLHPPPFGYWIDIPPWAMGMTDWSKYGLPDSYAQVPAVQGGHLWVDKAAAWKLLCMVHQGNEHSDYWYTHSNHDQSLFRGALAYGACPGFEAFGNLDGHWLDIAFECQYKGKPLITHYCKGKVHMPDFPRSAKVPGDRERLREWVELVSEAVG